MRKPLLPYLLILCLSLIFTPSCQAPKELEYREFKNLKIEKIGFGGSSLKVDVIYYNPNNFGLQLKYAELDIFIDGSYLGHSSQDYQITIKRLEEFTLPLQINLDMQNLLKNTLPTLLGKEVTVKITGKVKIGKANVYKTFPVNYEAKQRFVVF